MLERCSRWFGKGLPLLLMCVSGVTPLLGDQVVTETLTIPKGTQLASFQVFEWYGRHRNGFYCIYHAEYCAQEYDLNITGPGISFKTIHNASDGRAAPPSGYDFFWSDVLPDYEGYIRSDPRYSVAREDLFDLYLRESTQSFDVEQYAKNGDIQVTVTTIYYKTIPYYWRYNPAGGGVQVFPLSFILYSGQWRRPLDDRESAANLDDSGASTFDFAVGVNGAEAGEGRDPNALQLGKARVEFYLSPPAWNTAQPNLSGTSSNGTRPDSTENDPDFIFDDKNNRGMVLASRSTIATVDWKWQEAASASVTSRDFGGSAILKAKVHLGGFAFDVSDIIQNDRDQRVVQFMPPACAGTGGFAMLPVDVDCNGIADSWEARYLGQGQHFPSRLADDEPGPNPASPKGDGFSVFDEYRGFHYDLANDEPAVSYPPKPGVKKEEVQWTDTDPVSTQDVFFWDTSANGQFTAALKAILAKTFEKHKYRRVTEEQAQPATAGNPADGVLELNYYSPNKTQLHGFALAYVNQAPPPSPGGGMSPGYTAKQGSMGQAVFLDDALISATSDGDPDVYRAAILAHETGHVYGLCHYYDVLSFMTLPADLTTFPLTKYSITTNPTPNPDGSAPASMARTIFRANTYIDATDKIITEDAFDTFKLALAANILLNSADKTPAVQQMLAGWGAPVSVWSIPNAMVQNDWLYSLPRSGGPIGVARQYGYMMDKYLRFHQSSMMNVNDPGNLQFSKNWRWRPASDLGSGQNFVGDLPHICVACHTDRQCGF